MTRRRRLAISPQPRRAPAINLQVSMPRATPAPAGPRRDGGGGDGPAEPTGPVEMAVLSPNYEWFDYPSGSPTFLPNGTAPSAEVPVGPGGEIATSETVAIAVRGAPLGAVIEWTVTFEETPGGGTIPPAVSTYDAVLVMHFAADASTPRFFRLGTYAVSATVDGVPAIVTGEPSGVIAVTVVEE